MSKQIEKSIQRATVDFVRNNYPEIIIHATSNEHSYDKHNDYCLGIPDLILIHPSNGLLLLELKTSTGKLNKNQIQWNANFDAITFAYPCQREVAYGFAEAKRIIAAFAKYPDTL